MQPKVGATKGILYKDLVAEHYGPWHHFLNISIHPSNNIFSTKILDSAVNIPQTENFSVSFNTPAGDPPYEIMIKISPPSPPGNSQAQKKLWDNSPGSRKDSLNGLRATRPPEHFYPAPEITAPFSRQPSRNIKVIIQDCRGVGEVRRRQIASGRLPMVRSLGLHSDSRHVFLPIVAVSTRTGWQWENSRFDFPFSIYGNSYGRKLQ